MFVQFSNKDENHLVNLGELLNLEHDKKELKFQFTSSESLKVRLDDEEEAELLFAGIVDLLNEQDEVFILDDEEDEDE